ncbi:hypothetical protein IX51_09745 [uncultured archaeon]|nr:hypothetical protein IX51_09745 [uncultured archaeon]
METLPVDKDNILKELKKFYRNSGIELVELEEGLLFTIDSYTIRDSDGKKCRIALCIRDGKGEVLVDTSFEDLKKYLKGAEATVSLNGNRWISVPKRYFWEYYRPSYWFVERNLTEFFRG